MQLFKACNDLEFRNLEYVLGNVTRLKSKPCGLREQFSNEVEQKREDVYRVY